MLRCLHTRLDTRCSPHTLPFFHRVDAACTHCSHANLAAAGQSAAGTRGFQTVIFSYAQKMVPHTKLYCFLRIQKDDGLETKMSTRVLEYRVPLNCPACGREMSAAQQPQLSTPKNTPEHARQSTLGNWDESDERTRGRGPVRSRVYAYEYSDERTRGPRDSWAWADGPPRPHHDADAEDHMHDGVLRQAAAGGQKGSGFGWTS